MTHQDICTLCEKHIDPEAEKYVQATVWLSTPKMDSPTLREYTGKVAHADCIKLVVKGISQDQLELEFYDDEVPCNCVGLSHKDSCPNWVLPL